MTEQQEPKFALPPSRTQLRRQREAQQRIEWGQLSPIARTINLQLKELSDLEKANPESRTPQTPERRHKYHTRPE